MDLVDFLKNLKDYGLKNDIPNISQTSARFLYDLIILSKAKNILEIGTANGYSTIWLASAVEKNDGRVISFEFSKERYAQAVENITKAGFFDRCDLLNENAIDYIPKLENNSFDFVFIDGTKRSTRDFLNVVYPKIKRGGIIIIDDVIKFKEKMVGLFVFLKENRIDYNVLPIDIDDGVMMIIKK